jgi:hypothetical protein
VKLIKYNAGNVNIDNYHYYLMARVRNLEVLRTGLGMREYLLIGASSDPDEGDSDACSSCGDEMLSSLSIPEWSMYLTLAV